MPRPSKTKATEKPTAATAEKPARTRKTQRNAKETAPEAAPAPEFTAKELELRSKYPHDILPGSYRVAGAEDRPSWGKKHTVLVKCATEGCTAAPRCVATSDLQFVGTTRFCLPCAKHIKANRRRTKDEKKKLV